MPNNSQNNNPEGKNQFTEKGSGQGGQQDKQGQQNQQSGSQGFASMDPERQREIASEGGRAAHASGNAHEFNSQEARDAGSMSHKNDANRQSGGQGGSQSGASQGGGTRGGTPEQHAEAGRQSHKND